MPFTHRFRDSIAANATQTIDLGPLSRMPAAGQLEVFANCPTDGAIRMTVLLGTDIVEDRGFLNVAATTGRVQVPEDIAAQGFGASNDPITIRLENTSGAAVIAQGLVRIT